MLHKTVAHRQLIKQQEHKRKKPGGVETLAFPSVPPQCERQPWALAFRDKAM